jgi:hypothetical protein
MAYRWKKQKTPGRQKLVRKVLETAIAEAVKKSDPQCEAFVGVWVEPCAQQSGKDANWVIKGILFGKADRDKCGSALTAVVKRMQEEFELRPDEAASAAS